MQELRLHGILPAQNRGRTAYEVTDTSFEKTKVEGTEPESHFYLPIIAESFADAQRAATILKNSLHISVEAEEGSAFDFITPDNPSSV